MALAALALVIFGAYDSYPTTLLKTSSGFHSFALTQNSYPLEASAWSVLVQTSEFRREVVIELPQLDVTKPDTAPRKRED